MPNKIDISRFASGLNELFAPAIQDNQSFTVFLDEPISLQVLTDNVLANIKNGNFELLDETFNKIADIVATVSALQKKIRDFSSFCAAIPVLQAQISDLYTDEATSQPYVNEFNYSYLYEELHTITDELLRRIEDLESNVSTLSATLEDNDSNEIIRRIEQLQEDFDKDMADVSAEIALIKSSLS